MSANLDSGKVSTRTVSSGSSQTRSSKLTKELQDNIAQLRTELSVGHANNLEIVRRKSQELKKVNKTF